jgi:hypothetical protein
MTARELPTRSAFQIFLECAGFALRFERDGRFDSPRSVFGRVRTRPLIVFQQTLFKVMRSAGVVNGLISLAD